MNGSESSDQPVDRFYRSFFEAEPPPGSSASKAWRGTIQPFASDEIAKKLLRHLDRDLPVDVDHGELLPLKGMESVIEHWLEPMLVQMTTRFSILVLDYGNGQHPRTFSLTPRISNLSFRDIRICDWTNVSFNVGTNSRLSAYIQRPNSDIQLLRLESCNISTKSQFTLRSTLCG